MYLRFIKSLSAVLILFCFTAWGQEQAAKPGAAIFQSAPIPRYVPRKIIIEAVDKTGQRLKNFNRQAIIHGVYFRGENEALDVAGKFDEGVLVLEEIEFEGKKERPEVRERPLKISFPVLKEKGVEYGVDAPTFAPWLSLLPPLLAIALAIITKEVLIALFIGVWVGVFTLCGYNPFSSFLATMDTNVVHALSEKENIQVLVFSLTIGGMIGILANCGGIADMVNKISRWAKTRRSGILATWLMGLAIFFDDYANTLLVGNSMRPITDRLRISREKLTYLVDSTAAPVASLALVSTWIGTEIKYIGDVLSNYGQGDQAFNFFINSIPFRFYSILTIVFCFLLGYMRRDFGPMLKAERRTIDTGKVMADGATPLAGEMETIDMPKEKLCRWYNAVIPILAVIAVTLGGLYYTGYQELKQAGNLDSAGLRDIIGKADTYKTLIWAALLGSLAAFTLTVGQRILNVAQTCQAWVVGLKRVMPAMLVLVLAWTLKDLCNAMGTSNYIFYAVKDRMFVQLLPFFAFLLSAVVAFATGTSWGTMGLLFPVLLDLAIKMSTGGNIEGINTGNYILMGTVGSILAGASFGDHCSPISDTTVMSSMACACDHVDHVRTQMPYAVTTAAVGAVLGYIPIGFGVSPWICLLIGSVVLVAVLRFLGKTTE